MRHNAGFTVIEVLIAVVLLAVALGAIISTTTELGEVNARAEVQAVAASAAEAVAVQYALTPPAPGETRRGQVGTDVTVPGLTPEQREIADRLAYELTGLGGGAVRIRVRDTAVHNDPYALELITTP